MSTLKRADCVPDFATEEEERIFWETHDSADAVDWGQAQGARFPNLKPTTRPISLRLPEPMLERIRQEANRRDVPYQSLIKMWLAEKLKENC